MPATGKTSAAGPRQGWPEIWLLTGSDSGLRAVGFYLHLGWQAAGRQADGQTRYVKRQDLSSSGASWT
jgi:hypothetical protein